MLSTVAAWDAVAQGLPVPRSLRIANCRDAVSSSSVSMNRCRRASLFEPHKSSSHTLKDERLEKKGEKKKCAA